MHKGKQPDCRDKIDWRTVKHARRNERYRRMAAAVALALAPVSTWGADGQAPAADEKIFLEEQPVVLTVSRLSQPLNEAPAAVTVIDRRMIEASGFRDIPSLLRLVPGFQVVYARGDVPAVTYHGLSSIYPRRMQVLVDGRSIYTTAYGQVLWRTLPLSIEDIDRIEVVRGPNAATDGINAFFATVNIITRSGGQDPGTLVAANVGDHNVRDATLRYSGQSGALDYRITLSRRQDDWYPSLFDSARERFVNARVDYRPTVRDEINVQGGISAGTQAEGVIGGTPYDPPRDTEPQNYFVQAKWRRSFDFDTEISLHAHHTVDDTRDVYALRIPRVRSSFPPDGINIPYDQNYRLVRTAVELSGSMRPLQNLRLAGAGEVRYDSARSVFYTGSDRLIEGYIYRLSGAGEYRIRSDWLLHFGAMIEKNYSIGTEVSPRIALSYLPSPAHSFRLSVSRGYRSPTYLENYADVKWQFGAGLLNQEYKSPGNLAPEKITSMEVGYMFREPAWGITFDSRVFYNRVHDIIELFTVRWPAPNPELFGDGTYRQFANRFEARQKGVEFTARWQPARNSWIVWNQTWTATESNNFDYSNSTPNNDMSVLGSHYFGEGITASAGFYRQNGMTWIGSAGGGRIPNYDRVDARIAKFWNVAGRRVELAFVVQGLLGGHLEQTPDRYFDRRYFTTLKLNL
jgi:iron complex outermembrane receptor protein